MPQFCDVAVPVPLDATFTYRIAESEPCVGGRVIVPFREKRLCGIVTELHDREPRFQTRRVSQVLDSAPALTPELMQLGRWIAQYYIAPIGEVFRTMLPLSAEFRRVLGYHITKKGIAALHAASTIGSSLRSHQEPEQQMLEYAVLNRLADGEVVREAALRSATGASRALLQTLLRKKWIARDDLSDVRDASRTVQIATLKDAQGKLNANQQKIVDYLRSQENQRAPVAAVRELVVPRTTLQTLVKRGIVTLAEEPAVFRMSGMKPRKLEFLFTAAQKAALNTIITATEERQFLPMLLHGITGSGKTAVYLSAMQAVLAKGRSAILLVPEIGLTPAVAADLHQIFADEVAILHSALSDDERAEQWKHIRKDEPLSRKLVEGIGERLARHEQVMVLLNRRGYSAFVLCRECGESVQCKNCAISMTYHKREHRLMCHYCGYTRPAPRTCPKCGSEFVQYLGTGSEKLEHILHGMFPQARIARLDRDTVRGRDDFERMLTALQAGEIDLLLGTQMIAKGPVSYTHLRAHET